MQNIPLFGSSASLISPPAGTVTSGYFPLQYYPAEHLNYYTNAATQAVQEIVSLVTAAGLTPSTSVQLPATISGILSGQAPTISKLGFNLPSTALTIDPQTIIRMSYQGLLYSYVSTTSFSIGAGVVGDSTYISTMYLSSDITKTTSAWAAGSGNGGLDTGAIGASTWYYIYVIKNPTSGVVDVLFSLSSTAPTMPTGYTLKRLVAATKTDGSNHIQSTLIMYSNGKQVWETLSTDINDSTLTTSRKSYTMVSIPNITMDVELETVIFNSANAFAYIAGDTNITDSAPSTSTPPVGQLNNVVGGSANSILLRLTMVSNVLYARSSAASTTFVATAASFNIRPYN